MILIGDLPVRVSLATITGSDAVPMIFSFSKFLFQFLSGFLCEKTEILLPGT